MKSICLNMIVKDESHIIKKTLENLCSYINFSYWVISDTGSTDNTKEIITAFFKEKHIPGEIVEHEWRDFGYNRTKALEAIYFKTDYLFIFDADDSIHGDFKIPDVLDADKYCLKMGEEFTYMRPLLVSNKKKWKFVGVLHEFLVSCEDTYGEKLIDGDYYVDSGKSGSRSQDPNKYLNDAKILEKGYHDECHKEDGLACRYAFYCAQSYKDYGNNDKSIEWYEKVLTLNNWSQEKYYTCITLGDLYKAKNDNETAIKYWLKSVEYDKERIEGVVSACEHYRYANMNILVNLLYEKFKNYNKKPQNKLFLACNRYNDELEYQNSVCAYYIGEHESGYECCKKILVNSILDYSNTRQVSLNLNFYRKQLEDDEDTLTLFYMYDNLLSAIDLKHDTVENIHYELWNILFEKNRNLLTKYKNYSFKNKDKPLVFLSFTTCKRLDLFSQTINSILTHWTDADKIDYWFCVDDNSSEEDRSKMREKYNWIEYYMKNEGEKGHRESMNIIWSKLDELKPKYWIHMEDDFLFHKEMDYVTTSISALDIFKEKQVKQILFNRGYGETLEDYKIKSFVPSEEFIVLQDYKKGSFNYPNCHYWPYYSFRPSIIDVETILALGNYDSDNQFFEMDYANKWTEKGHKSAFFNTITNRHIGRLTTERNNNDKTNAYTLNSEEQFVKKSPFIKIINLKRREDRKQNAIDKLTNMGICDYEFIEAVDGLTLTSTMELTTLFKGNDFGNRKGVIGCALSHYNLWKQLVDDTNHEFYVIMEDDFTPCKNFKERFEGLQKEFLEKEVLFLGYSMYEEERKKCKDLYNSNNELEIERLNKDLYIGGTFGYSINKTGAKKLLAFISENGIKHGIDYVVGKLNCDFAYEIRPQLFFSEWNEDGKTIDSDIQNNYEEFVFSSTNEDSNNNDAFIFIPHKDQIGNDIHYHKNSIADCMSMALKYTNCAGFNTLGYFKDNIDNLTASQYFGKTDGIYIKKEYYEKKNLNNSWDARIRVKMLCNWCSSEELCKEWSNMCENGYGWKNIEITWEDENIDYYIIINKPFENEFYNPEKTIIFQMEPWVNDISKNWGVKTWGEWSKPNASKFLYIGSHKNTLNCAQWWVNIPHQYPTERYDEVISILSNKNCDDGHNKRIKLSNLSDKIRVYGKQNYHTVSNYKGPLQYDKKENELIKYKYCLSVENNFEYNYATEKIWDGILCECLCFYWGCPNLENYIDSQAFVRLDLDDFEGSLKIIKQAIEEDWWSQRINIIRKEKQKILTELGFFPTLEKIINQNTHC